MNLDQLELNTSRFALGIGNGSVVVVVVVVLLITKLMSIVCRVVLCECLLDLFDVACNHIQWLA